MSKLRLLLWRDCVRSCKHCPNALLEDPPQLDWNEIEGYDEIILTGGEPLMYPGALNIVLREINAMRKDTSHLFLYTAMPSPADALIEAASQVSGVTLTVYNSKRMRDAWVAMARMRDAGLQLTNRLITFKDVNLPDWVEGWEHVVREYVKDCKLPDDEDFRRL